MAKRIILTAEDVKRANQKACERASNNTIDLTLHFMTLAEVTPIFGVPTTVLHRKDLKKIIEKPLLSACEILYDKNIDTNYSHGRATEYDVEQGHDARCYIRINYNSLSLENQEIGKTLGEVKKDSSFHTAPGCEPMSSLFLHWNLPPTTKASVLEQLSVETVRKFKQQHMSWVHTFEMDEVFAYTGDSPDNYENPLEEAIRLAPSLGYHYCPEENLFYLSKEHYDKSRVK